VRRQLIAERLIRSIQTIPTFSVSAEANAELLLKLYSSVKESTSTTTKTNLSITDLLLAIFAQVLNTSREINAVWQNNEVHVRESVDIGLAVATDKGVIAPVIRNVDSLSLPALAATRAELVDKARKGRLALTDLEGGVGTLSNLGMYRVDHFQAIISPGQSSILAVGQIRKRAWVEEAITIKPTIILNLTVDHRVADGAAAAVFLGKILELIEKPQNLQTKVLALSKDGAGGRSNA
jgi:pyruvate dehydrogenase E2 component (dihydrolipoamide acetyltransferase)